VQWANSYYATPAHGPEQITGLIGWWDATRDQDFTYSTGNDPANPGNKYVSQWNDRSGNNNHAVGNANLGYHPHRDATINGLKAVDFAALGSYVNVAKGLEIPTWLASTTKPSTYVMALRLPPVLINNGEFIGCAGNAVILRATSTGAVGILISAIGGGGSTPAGTIVGGETCVLACSWDAAGNWSIRKNGVQVGAGVSATAPAGSLPMGLGARTSNATGGSGTNATIGEALSYNRALTVAEVAQVENHLKTKWGIA